MQWMSVVPAACLLPSRTRRVLSAFWASALRTNSTNPKPSESWSRPPSDRSCQQGAVRKRPQRLARSRGSKGGVPVPLGRAGLLFWRSKHFAQAPPTAQTNHPAPAPWAAMTAGGVSPGDSSLARVLAVAPTDLKDGAHSVLGRGKSQVLHKQDAPSRRRGRCGGVLGRLGALGFPGGGAAGPRSRQRHRSRRCHGRGGGRRTMRASRGRRPTEGAHGRPFEVEWQVLRSNPLGCTR